MTIEVIHIECYNPAYSRLETLRVTSSEDYIANGVANFPCISEMFDYSQSLFNRGTTDGDISVGVGTIVLNNADGSLDKYRTYGFDGRKLTIYKPKDKYDARTDSSTLFFTGTVLYAEFGWSKVTLHVKSRMEEINVPMQSTTFAGTNLGAGGDGGFEGSAQLYGKTKPQIFGRCCAVEGVPINEFFLIYAFNYTRDGEMAPLYAVYNVYVKGIRYLADTDYADEDALMAADLSAMDPGYYVTCLSKGLIRLSSTPASNGAVVADIADAPDENCTAAQVADRILRENAGFVPSVDYDAGELGGLDGFARCPTGIAVNDDSSIADCVNQVLDSIGGWFVPDVTGIFRFGRVDDPETLFNAGQRSLCTITSAQWENDIERVPVADKSQNIPAQSVDLLHTRAWHPQSSGALADAVDLERRIFLTTEYRTARAERKEVLEAHPLAPALTYKTVLCNDVYVGILDPNFHVEFGAKGGWGYSVGFSGSYSVSGSYVSFSPDGLSACYITQELSPAIALFTGVLEIRFVVKPDYMMSFEYSLDGEVSSAQFPTDGPFSEATECVVRIVVPPNSASLIITLGTIDTANPTEFGDIRASMLPQHDTPQDEAERRATLHSSFQERYVISVPSDFVKENKIELGRLVTLQDDERFDLQDGKLFLVIGVDPTNSQYKVGLDLWRAE